MHNKLFSIGQEVVCIKKKFRKPMNSFIPPSSIPDPVYNELYHIKEYVCFQWDRWFVSLTEMPEGCIYAQDCFAPVTAIGELMEECMQMEEAIT